MAPEHQARKRFGQNFLVDGQVVHMIVNAINPRKDEHIVEIGPGLGVLTQELLPEVKQLDVVELDRDLIPKLEATYLPLGNFAIHSADALKFDFCALAQKGEKLRIVGNLPYNISTPLMFKLLEQSQCIYDMHFMLQKEVVDRIVAPAGTSNYGRLSVMLQLYCHVTSLFHVPPSAFSPQPKVNSAVIRLVPYDTLPVDVKDIEQFSGVVSRAFAHRRKTLRNNLREVFSLEDFEQLNIDPSRRAETLSLDEFASIANYIHQQQT